jgi:hypothetical protein
MPELKDTKYYRELEQRAKSPDRTIAYRAQCELEDIAEFDVGIDHWDGPREDDPPKSWHHGGKLADTASGEPVFLALHRAEVQDGIEHTIYESLSGAFTLFIDWGYIDIDLQDDPKDIELQVTWRHDA